MKSRILLMIFQSWQLYCFGQELEYEKDKDIQEALIGISRKLDRNCPTVLIYDEQMPELSISYNFIKRMQERGRQFIMLNLSEDKLADLEMRYGTRNLSDIIQNVLYILYRQRRCYTFEVWVKDPRILYPDTGSSTNLYHPGWRSSDKVILVCHHITKRYKSLISLRFWSLIPNIVGLKRNNFEDFGMIKIFTVIPYFRNGKSKSQEIDTWLDSKREFVRNTTNFFYDKFTDFNNASIVLGVLWKEPFFIWGNKENPYLDGLDWRLFYLCQSLLNFRLSFKNVNTAGRKIGNDSWSGMMGHLANRTIDVGVGGISMTSDRLKYFDFCRSYYTDSFNFISPLNKKATVEIGTIFKPFSGPVWVAVFVSSFCGMVTLKIVTAVENRISLIYQTGMDCHDRHFLKFINICGFVVTILCQKPYRHLPQALPIQFVFHGISLTIFILGMVFSCCLISFILSEKPLPVADKVEQILKTGLPIVVKNYEGHLNDFMQFSGNPTLAKIYDSAQLVNYYESFEAMDDVVKGNKIYIDSKAKIHFSGRYRYSGSRGLKFHISSENIIEFANLGWAVQKNWPFRKPFDEIISRAVEGGLVQHWISIFMEGKFGGDEEAYRLPDTFFGAVDSRVRTEEFDPSVVVNAGFNPLSTRELGAIISFAIVGISLSICTFIVECSAELMLRICTKLRLWVSKKSGRTNTIATVSMKVQQPSGSPKFLKPNVENIKAQKKEKLKGTKLTNTKRKKKQPYPELVWNDFGIQLKSRKHLQIINIFEELQQHIYEYDILTLIEQFRHLKDINSDAY